MCTGQGARQGRDARAGQGRGGLGCSLLKRETSTIMCPRSLRGEHSCGGWGYNVCETARREYLCAPPGEWPPWVGASVRSVVSFDGSRLLDFFAKRKPGVHGALGAYLTLGSPFPA